MSQSLKIKDDAKFNEAKEIARLMTIGLVRDNQELKRQTEELLSKNFNGVVYTELDTENHLDDFGRQKFHHTRIYSKDETVNKLSQKIKELWDLNKELRQHNDRYYRSLYEKLEERNTEIDRLKNRGFWARVFNK